MQPASFVSDCIYFVLFPLLNPDFFFPIPFLLSFLFAFLFFTQKVGMLEMPFPVAFSPHPVFQRPSMCVRSSSLWFQVLSGLRWTLPRSRGM